MISLQYILEHTVSLSTFGLWLIDLCVLLVVNAAGDRLKGWLVNRRFRWRVYAILFFLGLACLPLVNWCLKIVCIGIVALSIFTFFFYLPHEAYLKYYFAKHYEVLHEFLTRHNKRLTVPGKIMLYKLLICKTDGFERAEYEIEYVDALKQMELMHFEKKIYFLPALFALYKNGAVRRLDEEIESISFLQDNWQYQHLVCCSCYQKCDYTGMITILKKLDSFPNINKSRQLIDTINKVCASLEGGDIESYKYYIKDLERFFEKEHLERLESIGDLLYFYNRTHNNDKIGRIRDYIYQRDYKNFVEQSEYFDILYHYYKETNDREECIKLVNNLEHKCMDSDDLTEEEKLLYGLQIVRLKFENDSDWQKYSRDSLRFKDTYSAYSYRVAMKFANITHILNKDANTVRNLILDEQDLMNISKTIVYYEDHTWKGYREKLFAELPEEALYPRLSLRMDEFEISYFRSELDRDLNSHLKERLRLVALNIDECEQNGDIRDQLHFINVFIDEIITFLDIANDNIDVPEVKSIFQQKSYYIGLADKYIKQMTDICEQYKYNRFLAYYLLFLTRYYLFRRDRQRAEYFFAKFENYNVPVTNFTLVIQKMYEELKNSILSTFEASEKKSQ